MDSRWQLKIDPYHSYCVKENLLFSVFFNMRSHLEKLRGQGVSQTEISATLHQPRMCGETELIWEVLTCFHDEYTWNVEQGNLWVSTSCRLGQCICRMSGPPMDPGLRRPVLRILNHAKWGRGGAILPGTTWINQPTTRCFCIGAKTD